MAILRTLRRAARALGQRELRGHVAGALLSGLLRSGLVERAVRILRPPPREPMGGDRLRAVPDNVVPFPDVHRFVGDVMDQANAVRDALVLRLTELGFKPVYIDHVIDDLVDAWVNEDDVPVWHRTGYVPPGTDLP